MRYKKSMIILALVIFLFSIAAVSASDVDDGSVASKDTDQMELSQGNETIEDNLQVSEEDTPLEQSNYDETVGAENESEILSENEGTYSDLRNDIAQGGSLTKSIYHYRNGDGKSIEISNSMVIDGNGAVIDMAGSNIEVFLVTRSTITIKNLTIKNVNYDSSGGAIYLGRSSQGTVENCNFTNIYAYYGGGVYCDKYSTCTVRNCNFIDTDAMMKGGAINFESTGNVANCNFTNCEAYYGGAVYIALGSVENCTFIGNGAEDGGAIYMDRNCKVINCNFTGNSVKHSGGAIKMHSSSVENCNFADNRVTGDNSGGGAIWMYSGTVSNCNFTDNIARKGGAVSFYWEGAVSNCNFTGNNATTGAAIYFEHDGTPKTISNSYFLNNRANVEELQVTKNEVNIIIVLTGKNNLLNAIYSASDVNFANVTYWGVNGIDNTDNYALLSRSNREAGQNITIEIYDSDDNLVKNITLVSDENGQVTYEYLKLNSGNYKYKVYHPNDCYYSYSEKTGEFSSDFGDFNRLQRYINNADPNSVLTLSRNYTFTIGKDENLTDGIVINKQITVNGNGYTIDANGKSRIFQITGNNVVLENITFINGYAMFAGSAVYFSQSGTIKNCNFTNNSGSNRGGAVYFSSRGNVADCNFINNTATEYGGAVYFEEDGDLTNCNFVKNSAYWGGAIFDGIANLINCNFADNSALRGGAIHIYSGSVTNCSFTGNNASNGSAIYFHDASGAAVSHSVLLNNRADAEALDIIQNENNITIIFAGKNNLLNAIYSGNNGGVTFTNVTYWGANGINNTGSISRLLSPSNRQAGQNVTIRIIADDELVLNDVRLTDENGEIVLENVKLDGSYYVIVRHDSDSYYAEAVNIATNMEFYANVTPVTTHNRTVNITAESNIVSEEIPGKLLFILPNGMNITANHASNGIWWAVHTFEDYDDYEVSATHVELDNVIVSNATISITKADSAITIDKVVFNYGDSNVTVTAQGADGITAKIDGNNVTVVGFTIPISGLNVGTYNLTVTTIADEDHNPVTVNATITVNKLKTQIAASAITTTYNINKNLVITLKDSNGNALTDIKVTVDLNGAKTYTTDKDGQIKVSTKGLAPKAYVAKVTFDGNTNYVKSTMDARVTVKKATPKMTAKKKTFKKSTKTKKYAIVLKDNTGKAIKKAKVTLKVKGKTYKAKTNSKGKATFKITKLKKKGTFKAVIKFAGNKYYNKLTKKVKVKVR